MQTLYPNPATRRLVESAVASNKLILWIYDSSKSLYFNPGITSGSIAGAVTTPSDGGVAFAPDYIVRGGCDGFAAALRKAGLYTGNGLSSESEDCSAAQKVFSGVSFVHGAVCQGS